MLEIRVDIYKKKKTLYFEHSDMEAYPRRWLLPANVSALETAFTFLCQKQAKSSSGTDRY